jgi:hypothetical protein
MSRNNVNSSVNSNGSKGLLASIEETGSKSKNDATPLKSESIQEYKGQNNQNVKEGNSKRSYVLKNSTIKKLQELKVFVYPEPDITYNEIVDKAICALYEKDKG